MKIVKKFILSAALCFIVMLILFLTLIYPRKSIANILMYHSVTIQENGPTPSINTRLFDRQMDFLSRHGYETVFLETVIDRYNEAKKVPPPPLNGLS